MGQDPSLARKRVRTSQVARGRALVAWLWVEIMGRPQVMVAEGLNVRPGSVCTMISKIRREGLKRKEEQLLESVLEKVTKTDNDEAPGFSSSTNLDPKVLVLKRRRKG